MSLLSLLGWAGNACFFSRFLVQWWLSERAKESVAPRVFWWLSLAGSVTLGMYAFVQGELPLVPGYVITFGIYLRNLWITSRGPEAGRIGAVPALLLGIAAAVLLIVTGAIPESDSPFETPWLVVGFVGQAIWSSRFVVQWWMSERSGHSHFPRVFWWLSLAGNVFLLAYALHRGDPVFIAGYLIGPLVQIRNLMLGRGKGAAGGAAAAEPASPPGHDLNGTMPRFPVRVAPGPEARGNRRARHPPASRTELMPLEREERHARDLLLVQAVLRGDEAARAEFATRMACAARILAARNRRIGSPLDRDELVDLVQDVQLHVWRKLGTFAGHAALESWVYRFCHLRLLKYLERRDLRRARTQLLSQEILEESAPSRVSPSVEGRDDGGIEHYLRHLSPREAEVARLRYVAHLEFGEIAEALGISVSSAKTHCYRALEKLRPILVSRAAHLDGETR